MKILVPTAARVARKTRKEKNTEKTTENRRKEEEKRVRSPNKSIRKAEKCNASHSSTARHA